MYDPWEDLLSRPGLVFGVTRLPHGRGWWLPERNAIVLDDRLGRVARRCALAHELAHVEADDRACAGLGPGCDRIADRQEWAADQLAARWLVALPDLAAALLAHGDDVAAVAEELDVESHVIVTRVQRLHPAERHYLRRRLAEKEAAA